MGSPAGWGIHFIVLGVLAAAGIVLTVYDHAGPGAPGAWISFRGVVSALYWMAFVAFAIASSITFAVLRARLGVPLSYAAAVALTVGLAAIVWFSWTAADQTLGRKAIARLASIENVVLVHPSVPAKTLKEFIALARAKPGKLNYGSGGPGTTNHLANELLRSLEKINMVHVPYKGATVATTALMGGEVDEVIVSVASVLPLIKAGRVRALAVLSPKRVATLPDVPTSKEAGFPNFQMSIWYGLFGPPGMPREIVNRLHREVAKALEDPTLRTHMANAGMDPWLGGPDEMGALLRSETARYAKIIQSAGIKKDAL